MKPLSNSDYALVLRLLYALSNTKGQSIKECENARKAALLYKKLRKKDSMFIDEMFEDLLVNKKMMYPDAFAEV